MGDQKQEEGGPTVGVSASMRTMMSPLSQGHMKLQENIVLGEEYQGPFEGIS